MATRSSFFLDIRHEGLKKFRRISGPDPYMVQERARVQLEAWEDTWRKIVGRVDTARAIEEKKDQAAKRHQQAQEALEAISGVLAHTLAIDDRVKWETLKNAAGFDKPALVQPPAIQVKPEPRSDDAQYQP